LSTIHNEHNAQVSQTRNVHHLKMGGKHVLENSDDWLGGLRWEMEINVHGPIIKLKRNSWLWWTQTARYVEGTEKINLKKYKLKNW